MLKICKLCVYIVTAKYVLSFRTQNKYRIMTVLKVETDIIIGCIEPSQIGRVVMIVIIYVENFKTDVIGFFLWCHNAFDLTLWPIVFSVDISLLIVTISLWETKGKMSKLLIIYFVTYILVYWMLVLLICMCN